MVLWHSWNYGQNMSTHAYYLPHLPNTQLLDWWGLKSASLSILLSPPGRRGTTRSKDWDKDGVWRRAARANLGATRRDRGWAIFAGVARLLAGKSRASTGTRGSLGPTQTFRMTWALNMDASPWAALLLGQARGADSSGMPSNSEHTGIPCLRLPLNISTGQATYKQAARRKLRQAVFARHHCKQRRCRHARRPGGQCYYITPLSS